MFIPFLGDAPSTVHSTIRVKHFDGCVTISSKWHPKNLLSGRSYVESGSHLMFDDSTARPDFGQIICPWIAHRHKTTCERIWENSFAWIRIPSCQSHIASMNGRWSPNGRQKESEILGSQFSVEHFWWMWHDIIKIAPKNIYSHLFSYVESGSI